MTDQVAQPHAGPWPQTSDKGPGGVKGAARSLARALGTIRPAEPQVTFKPAVPFGELHIFQTMNKHRSVASMFGLKNPFYRAHDGRLGATAKHEGRELTNFASYDYLGLNQEPAVAEAAKAAIDEAGTSVSASRLVAGERILHRELETELANFYGADACLAFVSGHATNISTIGMLMAPEDLIVQDELMHNSAIVGAKLSRATSINFRHNHLDDLEKVLRENRANHKNALIVAEGLYSMDGDFPDLPRLVEIKKRYGAWLMIDEAHSLGVMGKTGRGSFEHFGIDPRGVDIWMGTLSKTLGSCGGYICGTHDLIEILKYQAPGFVYSVGLSPPATAAALAALRILRSDPQRVAKLQANGRFFVEEAKKAGLDTMTSAGFSVVPIMIGDPVRAVRLTDRLLDRGINALPIIHPAVPMKAARIRFFITSRHTQDQIRDTIKIVTEELANVARRQSLMEKATLAVVAR
jgi:8-amino-7-oxononanoate synthase